MVWKLLTWYVFGIWGVFGGNISVEKKIEMGKNNLHGSLRSTSSKRNIQEARNPVLVHRKKIYWWDWFIGLLKTMEVIKPVSLRLI